MRQASVRVTALVFASAIGGLLPAARASAQPSAPPPGVDADATRPNRTLFGGAAAPRRTAMTVDFSGYGGYDDNVLAQATEGGAGVLENVPGQFVGARAALELRRPGRRVTFALGGDSTVRRLSVSRDLPTINGSGSLSMAAILSQAWTLRADQQAGYMSFFSFTPVSYAAGETTTPVETADLTVGGRPAIANDTTVAISRKLGRRSLWSAEIGTRGIYFTEGPGRLTNQRLGTSYDHPFSRYATLRLGYEYSTGDYTLTAGGGTTALHNIDAGIRYARRPSFSRRSTIGFTTGAAVIERSPGADNRRTFLRLLGSANLRHEIGRTWTIFGAYNRTAQFVQMLPGVLSANAVSTGASGALGRRVTLTLDASHIVGVLSLGGFDDPLSSDLASARLRIAATRLWAFDLAYLYYRYDLSGRTEPSAVIRQPIKRQGLRAGFTLRLPTIGRKAGQ